MSQNFIPFPLIFYLSKYMFYKGDLWDDNNNRLYKTGTKISFNTHMSLKFKVISKINLRFLG